VFRASIENDHQRRAKTNNTHPLSVIGWNTIYFVFSVVGSTICIWVRNGA
jgi:hypothetical protein